MPTHPAFLGAVCVCFALTNEEAFKGKLKVGGEILIKRLVGPATLLSLCLYK